MAIQIISGLQGSGKSYLATYKIYKLVEEAIQNELDNKPPKYNMIYTNIEGIIENKYIKPLSMKELINIWEWEHKQYLKFENRITPPPFPEIDFQNMQSKKNIDKQLTTKEKHKKVFKNLEKFDNKKEYIRKIIKKTEKTQNNETEFVELIKPIFKQKGFYRALFVIDEANNHFGRPLKSCLKRLAQYHRHYEQDYILIAQEHMTLDFNIVKLTSYITRARNPSMKIRDRFTYDIYSGSYISYNGSNRVDTFTLEKDPDVFELYNTGGKVKSTNILFKRLIKMSIIVIFGLTYYIYNILNPPLPTEVMPKKEVKKPNKPIPTTHKSQSKQMTKPISNNKNDKEYLYFTCTKIHSIVYCRTSNNTIVEIGFKGLWTNREHIVYYKKNLNGTITYRLKLTTDKAMELGLVTKEELKKDEKNNDPIYSDIFM